MSILCKEIQSLKQKCNDVRSKNKHLIIEEEAANDSQEESGDELPLEDDQLIDDDYGYSHKIDINNNEDDTLVNTDLWKLTTSQLNIDEDREDDSYNEDN